MTADEVIAALELSAHPEGGFFRETYRDAACTQIYYLLRRGERSHWHRVRHAAETWHHYAGAPVVLDIDGHRTVTLGGDLAAGERPQAVVPADAWQAAESRGDWSLVGCTVAPPFAFEHFELAPEGWSPR